uniref:CTLH domain-containing protein n=1 Tax=Kalanchoe fedtschenkoi TaxID=63787 RepID=A0A7N0RBM3_KALFE
MVFKAISDKDIQNIVVSYLVHNYFNDTAESFIASVKMKPPPYNLDDMEKRKETLRFVSEGNVPRAIELTEELAPGLLEKNKDMHFDLLCLHFVELVCAKKCTEAIEFAQTKLTSFGKVQKYVSKLEDSMAMLAYEEPRNSPMSHLLSADHRQQVADSLNRALLEHKGQPRYPALERLLQQATLARQYLTQENGKDLYPPFSLKDFFKS